MTAPNVVVQRVYIRAGDAGYIGQSESGEMICEATADGYMPICTPDPGHEGPHVAHGCDDQMLAIWPAAGVTP